MERLKKIVKKAFILCLAIIIFVPINDYAEGTSLGVPLKKEEQLAITFKNKQTELLVGDFILLPENNDYNKKSAQEMIMRIAQIHPTILKFFTEKNLKIKLFDGNITDEPNFEKLSGLVPRGWTNGLTWDVVPGGCQPSLAAAKIGASEAGNGHSSINLELHEIGHLFELNYQGLRNNNEYNNIWKEESQKLMPGSQYFQTYQDEYFAEAFAMYYLNNDSREMLKEKAQKTFSFLKKIENNSLLA